MAAGQHDIIRIKAVVVLRTAAGLFVIHFKPNHPVYEGVFAGRASEIDKIAAALEDARNGNPTNLLFLGERGIGKTSLMLFAKAFASSSDDSGFIPINISIGKNTTLPDFCRKVMRELERGLADSTKAVEFLNKAWSFVQRVEAFGVKLGAAQCPGNVNVLDELSYSLVDTIRALNNGKIALGLGAKKSGIVLLIDEADNAPRDLELGSVMKSLTEKLVAEDCNSFVVIMAGLPDVRDLLLESHPSSLRIFEEISLHPLGRNDVMSVIKQGLELANKKNTHRVEIDDDALESIVFLSECYPHFVQQFAHSAYSADTNFLIDDNDVYAGAFGPNGALDAIGNRYYKDMYINQIQQESYREVLKIMATKWNEWITKQEIRDKFQGKETTLNNAINALVDRHIILRKQGTRGQYRLQWLGFAIWIRNFTDRDLRR